MCEERPVFAPVLAHHFAHMTRGFEKDAVLGKVPKLSLPDIHTFCSVVF